MDAAALMLMHRAALSWANIDIQKSKTEMLEMCQICTILKRIAHLYFESGGTEFTLRLRYVFTNFEVGLPIERIPTMHSYDEPG